MKITKKLIINSFLCISLVLLFFILLWRWCDIGFIYFIIAIVAGVFSLIAGLIWDHFKLGGDDFVYDVKEMQKARFALAVIIVSLVGIFDNDTPRVKCSDISKHPTEEKAEEQLSVKDSLKSSKFSD
tara:strand:- start:356 stop:736 length:381 start_codon:yes stop_codon:yes gene_type:complete